MNIDPNDTPGEASRIRPRRRLARLDVCWPYLMVGLGVLATLLWIAFLAWLAFAAITHMLG